MSFLRVLLGAFCVYWILPVAGLAQRAEFDLVIANGRVVDPESKLDAIRHVGIRGRSIAAISASPLKGKRSVDAKGQVVTAGFIDLHSHGQDDENYRFKAMDGVTTALEMEVGASPVSKWYAEREGKSLINFGATVGHIPARMALLGDTGTWLPRDKAITAQLNGEQKSQLLQTLQQGLNEGAIGVGFGLAYVYGATREEIFDAFKVAAKNNVTCFVHARSHGAIDPGSALEAMQEAIANAAGTGASLHIVHVTSTGLSQTPACLELIKGARQRGLDVTTEAYPYIAGMTGLETAIFSDGWQQKLNITYKDLQWVATGERLTAESFARYRQQGGLVVIFSIPEAVANLAVNDPDIMIASDGLLTNGKGHPRGAGSYARVLGYYVREKKTLSLMDALRKISLLPAQRLEKAVPMMRNKGRLKVGADADVVVFDPARVIDKATFENPAQYSDGITHVLVNGVAVVQDGKLIDTVKPGVAIRRARVQ